MKEKKSITKKWWFWVIAAVIVLGAIGAIQDDGKDEATEKKPAKEVVAKEQKTEEKAEEKIKEPTLSYTWDEVKSDWTKIVPEIAGTNIDTISDEKLTDQKENVTLDAKLTDYIHILGDLESDTNKVKYLSLLGEPSNDNSKNSDILTAFGNLIAVSNPDLTAEQRGDILMDKLKFSSGDFTDLNETYEFEGVTYKASNIGGVLTVSIGAPKE